MVDGHEHLCTTKSDEEDPVVAQLKYWHLTPGFRRWWLHQEIQKKISDGREVALEGGRR